MLEETLSKAINLSLTNTTTLSKQIATLNNTKTSTIMNNSELLEENMDRIQLLADIGYLLSLLTLLFALLILTCIKRLRSPKNNLHLQLFISFIIRCALHLVRALIVHRDILGFTLDVDVSIIAYKSAPLPVRSMRNQQVLNLMTN